MSKVKVTLECVCDKYKDLQTPCCDFFKQMLNDCKVRLYYKPRLREFGISLVGSSSIQLLYFCPWCGASLPKGLEDEYDQVLIKEYGIKDPDDLEVKDSPAEMQTDEWWKKRGL